LRKKLITLTLHEKELFSVIEILRKKGVNVAIETNGATESAGRLMVKKEEHSGEDLSY
jgi:pyruvate-formate lyase-activating enzyme